NIQIQISGVTGGQVSQSLWAAFAYITNTFTTMTGTAWTLGAVSGAFAFTYQLGASGVLDLTSGLGLALSNLTTALSDYNLVFTGAVRLRSSAAITIASASDASTALGVGGLTVAAGLTVAIDTSHSLSNLDLSTRTGASDALLVVDATLQALTDLRARL